MAKIVINIANKSANIESAAAGIAGPTNSKKANPKIEIKIMTIKHIIAPFKYLFENNLLIQFFICTLTFLP